MIRILEIVGIADGTVFFVFGCVVVSAYWVETWHRWEYRKKG